jgi:hypothetical protein
VRLVRRDALRRLRGKSHLCDDCVEAAVRIDVDGEAGGLALAHQTDIGFVHIDLQIHGRQVLSQPEQDWRLPGDPARYFRTVCYLT